MEENFNQINDINFFKKMFATNVVEGERLNTFPFRLLQRQRWIFFQLLSIAKSQCKRENAPHVERGGTQSADKGLVGLPQEVAGNL